MKKVTHKQALMQTLALFSALHGASPAAVGGDLASPNETVIIPVVSINITANTCTSWEIQQTWTATPAPASVIQQLTSYNYFSTTSHYHASNDNTNGSWTTSTLMSGNNTLKLAQINKQIFGTSTPFVGQRTTHRNSHAGSCAADKNMRECVGLFVSETQGNHYTPTTPPTTFPAGMCSGIPPVGVSCTFDTIASTVHLGSGGRGGRHGETSISYSCSRPTSYRIRATNSPDDDSGISITNMYIDGHPLPYVGSTSSGGVMRSRLAVEAVVTKEGSLGTSRVLYIDIP